MNNKIYKFIACCICAMIIVSCDEDLPRYAQFSAYEYSSLDEDGGTWVPVLLESASEIDIPEPEDVNSTAYQTELAAVKTATSSLTSRQKELVDYWTNNPIIRWSEIAQELITKYNLIPGPNDDGTYTLPNPASPQGPPPFPFAHPAYGCRALAYLTVAQFDGLISAWYHKYEYERPAPYVVDTSIPSVYGESNLPSYPSDGAVIASSAKDILSALFPLEKDYIAQRAEEHMQSLIWSGANVQSDIVAGEIIGKAVAARALQRAAGDRMNKSQTPKPVSDSIKNSAIERFGWYWENIEIPPRPVGLAPLFGKVQTWNVPDVALVRPGPPPAPGSAEFIEAANELKNHQKNMTEEKRKIANWWSDGLGTYTPPGHWNRLANDIIIEAKLNPLRSARALAYMNMAIMDAGIACWDAKYYYHYPRPIQEIKDFKTILGTPNFPSYTSGHSTFSAAAASVLGYLFPAKKSQCEAWAVEAAESRIYGGIHYRFDSEAGLEQGKAVAEYTIEKAKQDGAE